VSKRRAGDLGIARVQVEIDSLTLKIRYGVYSNSFELAAIGGIMFEIKDLLNLLFVSSIIPFCPRLCNCAAHALAAQGCISPRNSISHWDGMPPVLRIL
jgi:hypothetical protein